VCEVIIIKPLNEKIFYKNNANKSKSDKKYWKRRRFESLVNFNFPIEEKKRSKKFVSVKLKTLKAVINLEHLKLIVKKPFDPYSYFIRIYL